MKIIDERNKERTYGQIQIGKVFELSDCIYMKTDICERNCPDLLSVNLRTGEQYPIGCEVGVNLVDAKLTLIR